MGDTIGSDIYPWVGLSTEGKPPNAIRGQKAIETDTNDMYQWYGGRDSGSWVQIVQGGRTLVQSDLPDARVVNLYFHTDTATSTALAVASGIGDVALAVDDTTGFVVGSEITIGGDAVEHTFPATIIELPGPDLLILDRPLDHAHEIGAPVSVVVTDLSSAAGDLLTPISYKVHPPAYENWAIYRLIISSVFSSAADNSRYGNIAGGLTYGTVLREYGETRGFVTLTNWKTNADMINDMYDVAYTDKAGGGAFGLGGRWTFFRLGTAPLLLGASSEYLEILVQDDFTALTSFRVKAQGIVNA